MVFTRTDPKQDMSKYFQSPNPGVFQSTRPNMQQPMLWGGQQPGDLGIPENNFVSQRPTINSGGVGIPQAGGFPTGNAAGAGPTGGVLGPAPNADAIRRALVGSVPGATDAAGMPYNPTFDKSVQDLYASSMAKLAGYDQQQGQYQTDYEKNRGYLQQNQDLDLKQLMDRLAFQGILSSGITTDQRALMGQHYGQKFDTLASQLANHLNDLTSQRLGVQSDYQTKLGDLESGYVGNLAQWVQQQAQQQAARQQQQAQDAANAQLMEQLNAIQTQGNNQQIAMLGGGLQQANSKGPIDWAAVAKAVSQGMNLPVGYGGSLQ